jgi:hypothetical protein
VEGLTLRRELSILRLASSLPTLWHHLVTRIASSALDCKHLADCVEIRHGKADSKQAQGCSARESLVPVDRHEDLDESRNIVPRSASCGLLVLHILLYRYVGKEIYA